MPLEDRAQCIHETAVHNVSRIILAVLFGGQELVLIDSQVTEEEKEELIKTEAELWAAIQAKSPPQPNSPESARLLWPTSDETTLVANQPVEQACSQLRQIKDQIEEDGLIKKKISSSYFCHYSPGKLEIIPDCDYRPPELKKKKL